MLQREQHMTRKGYSPSVVCSVPAETLGSKQQWFLNADAIGVGGESP